MKHLFLTTSVLATCLASATQAGVIEERKAKFKENVAILRAIQTQIGKGDFEAIAARFWTPRVAKTLIFVAAVVTNLGFVFFKAAGKRDQTEPPRPK